MLIRKNRLIDEPLRGWPRLGLLLMFYLLLVAIHGYRFGDEDMSETLAYALYLTDPSLYPDDFYIQAVGAHWLNERLPFTGFLLIGAPFLEWWCFLLHAIFTLLLLEALIRIGERYLHKFLLLLGFLFISLMVLYHINLGGNEIWYHYFVPSQLAKALAVWSLVFFLDKKRVYAFLILIPATLAQPVVGAQLALIFALLQLSESYRMKALIIRQYAGVLIYTATAGLWIFSIFFNHLIQDQSLTGEQFYEIMEARLAHHWFPSYYPIKSWVILIPLMIWATFHWKKLDKTIFMFFIWSWIGMVIYTVLVEFFEMSQALSLQWFKITVWLKPLAVLALMHKAEQLIPYREKTYHLWVSATLCLILACLFLSRAIPGMSNRPYYFPTTAYRNSPDLDIALQVRAYLPPNSCLIIPPSMTSIRYFGRRSVYVDYKSNIHSKTYLAEAAQRRQQLYDLSIDLRRKGKDPVSHGENYYHQLNEAEFTSFKLKGASHVILRNTKAKLNLPISISNSVFTVYEL